MKIFFGFLTILLTSSVLGGVSYAIDLGLAEEFVVERIQEINTGSYTALYESISDTAPAGMTAALRDSLEGYDVTIAPSDITLAETTNSTAVATISYSISRVGPTSSISAGGQTNTIELVELTPGEYQITGGTIQNGLGVSFASWSLALIIGSGVIALLGLIFYIRMLIDVVKREMKDKALRVIVVIFGSGLGALVYYFVVRRPAIKESKTSE